jgi:hypothetical protein
MYKILGHGHRGVYVGGSFTSAKEAVRRAKMNLGGAAVARRMGDGYWAVYTQRDLRGDPAYVVVPCDRSYEGYDGVVD